MAKKNTVLNDYFLLFKLFFLVGSSFHFLEKWKSPSLALAHLFFLFSFVFFEKIRERIYMLFLTINIAYCGYKFPDLANHSNVLFFVGIPLWIAQFNYLVGRSYNFLFPLVRLMVLGLYFFVVFHKLNTDFFNPGSSCAIEKMSDYLQLLGIHYDASADNHSWLITLLPFMAIALEAIIALGLILKPFRWIGLMAAVLLHFMLAPVGFADFSGIAMALLWLFVSPSAAINEKILKYIKPAVISLLAFEGFIGLFRFAVRRQVWEAPEGLLLVFTFGAMWAFIFKRKSELVSVFQRQSLVASLYLFLFFVFGFSNYLGLRTAGTFSMFSNLVTEGQSSNHLLLGGNWLKLFSFQEDQVTILEVDERIRGQFRNVLNPGHRVPRVEFARMIDKAQRRSWNKIMLSVKYKDAIYTSSDFFVEHKKTFDVPYWQKKLMQFRLIQNYKPQYCHW